MSSMSFLIMYCVKELRSFHSVDLVCAKQVRKWGGGGQDRALFGGHSFVLPAKLAVRPGTSLTLLVFPRFGLSRLCGVSRACQDVNGARLKLKMSRSGSL